MKAQVSQFLLIAMAIVTTSRQLAARATKIKTVATGTESKKEKGETYTSNQTCHQLQPRLQPTPRKS
jgi:hypothetical protein